MTAHHPFCELIRRVRTGDQEAAAELVQLYEPEVRRFIRVKLTDPRLRRVFDSVDIFQSVFANFFVRFMAGQFDLDEPSQLVKLLATMARNKIIDHARKAAQRSTAAVDPRLLDGFPGREQRPSDIISRAEVLQRVRGLLTDEERHLAEERADGRSWPEIAAACGGTPDTLRKKLERAMDRVCRQLDVEGVRYA
jgi:RNA polymerase sigma-70 factor (ECF subfamily)